MNAQDSCRENPIAKTKLDCFGVTRMKGLTFPGEGNLPGSLPILATLLSGRSLCSYCLSDSVSARTAFHAFYCRDPQQSTLSSQLLPTHHLTGW